MDILQGRQELPSNQVCSCVSHLNSCLEHLDTSEISLFSPAEVPNQDNLVDDLAFLDEFSGNCLSSALADSHPLDTGEALENVPTEMENSSINIPNEMLDATFNDSIFTSETFDLSSITVLCNSEVDYAKVFNVEDVFQENLNLDQLPVSGHEEPRVMFQTESRSSHSTLPPVESPINMEYSLPSESGSGYISSDAEKIDDVSVGKKASTRYRQKYFEMRKKNNMASRRCRQNRKAKEEAMTLQVSDLEKENKKLRLRVEDLEKKVNLLRVWVKDAIGKK